MDPTQDLIVQVQHPTSGSGKWGNGSPFTQVDGARWETLTKQLSTGRRGHQLVTLTLRSAHLCGDPVPLTGDRKTCR